METIYKIGILVFQVILVRYIFNLEDRLKKQQEQILKLTTKIGQFLVKDYLQNKKEEVSED